MLGWDLRHPLALDYCMPDANGDEDGARTHDLKRDRLAL